MLKIGDFLSAFYPNNCTSCQEGLVKGESYICLNCELNFGETIFFSLLILIFAYLIDLPKKKIASHLIKQEHTILQLYGRFAIILGSLLVGLINLYVFSNIDKQHENLNQTYANIYLLSLIIPFISVSGVIISRIYSQHTIEKKSFLFFLAL